MFRYALLALFLAGPLRAESQDDILQADLLPGWRMANGHYMAALDLHMAPDWKTYWRAPGEAGIPPVFDWAGSENLKSVQFHWPSPQVLLLNGMTSIGYVEDLVLPVEVVPLDPSRPVTLALRVNLGICHSICVPAQVTLKAALHEDSAVDGRIAAALQASPTKAKGARCEVEPISDGLRLTAQIDLPRQGGSEVVIFETADPQVWVAQAQTARKGPVLTSHTDLVPPNGAPFTLDRSGVTVTVLAEGHATEFSGCPAP